MQGTDRPGGTRRRISDPTDKALNLLDGTPVPSPPNNSFRALSRVCEPDGQEL